MNQKNDYKLNRRQFTKLITAAAIAGPSLLNSSASASKTVTKTDELIHRNEHPSMAYCKLGRTNFMSSRLVFGCGAALAGCNALSKPELTTSITAVMLLIEKANAVSHRL